MVDRPKLNKSMDINTFHDYYYLKEELINFCRENGIPVTGGKIELTERISCFLETGEIKKTSSARQKATPISKIGRDTVIENNFVCSEIHRAFFKEEIGSSFSFNVGFQKWLKSNSGKTYEDAIEAYYTILEEKKKGKTTIDKQFEYNTYIRDFFEANKGMTLAQAIVCWKYKKQLPGHNCYEKSDLVAIEDVVKLK